MTYVMDWTIKLDSMVRGALLAQDESQDVDWIIPSEYWQNQLDMLLERYIDYCEELNEED